MTVTLIVVTPPNNNTGKDPFATLTLVVVTPPYNKTGSALGSVSQDVFVPPVLRYFPLLLVWLGASALNAAVAVICPVPPEVTASVADKDAAEPEVFWLSVGKVQLVSVPDVGVPSAPEGTT